MVNKIKSKIIIHFHSCPLEAQLLFLKSQIILSQSRNIFLLAQLNLFKAYLVQSAVTLTNKPQLVISKQFPVANNQVYIASQLQIIDDNQVYIVIGYKLLLILNKFLAIINKLLAINKSILPVSYKLLTIIKSISQSATNYYQYSINSWR